MRGGEESKMVVDAVYDLMETEVYMLVSGLVLLVAGVQGFVSPDQWALATGMVGQVFNLFPNLVHQALGALIGFGGLSQVVESVRGLSGY